MQAFICSRRVKKRDGKREQLNRFTFCRITSKPTSLTSLTFDGILQQFIFSATPAGVVHPSARIDDHPPPEVVGSAALARQYVRDLSRTL